MTRRMKRTVLLAFAVAMPFVSLPSAHALPVRCLGNFGAAGVSVNLCV